MAVAAESVTLPLGTSARVRGERLILTCFFVSGSCGLIYEIIWTRLLALVMGATVYSLTTVLVAFMAGLGLGAWLIGTLLRRHPGWPRLRLYGVFEIIIGLWCLALPGMFAAVRPLFGLIYNRLYGSDPGALFSYSLAQFAVCGPLILVPTTLMGATLPLLADHVTHQMRTVGRSVGLVYGVNTLGAMLGALATGYLLIPILGFSTTNLLAVAGNIAAGTVALLIGARSGQDSIGNEHRPSEAGADRDGERDVGTDSSPPVGRGVLVTVLAIFGFAGMAAMAYQIAWTRVISLIIDSTTYSFTNIVTCYILGLGLGAWLLSKLIDRERRPVLLLGLVQASVGLTALVTVPILGLLPPWVFFLMIRFHDTWWLMQLVVFGLVGALLLFPTMLMGATFPLVTRICTRRRGDVGPIVGLAYAVNALGTISGSFLAGFVLIPHPAVGMERTLLLSSALSVGLGVVAVLAAPGVPRTRRPLAAAGLIALWVGGLALCQRKNEDGERGWDKDIITSSPFFFYEQFFQGSIALDFTFREYLEQLGERVDYREGPFSTVVIRHRPATAGRAPGTPMIFTGGRPEASAVDVQQNVLMHLGMLLHPDPRRVCCVGLGSGSTARAATYHPGLEVLDVVEISEAVRTLSAEYFPEIHEDLSRAGAKIILADGRNHLALTEQMYDVIVSQPSHPHLTGVASLFTRDFFAICRERLAPGGVCVIWNFAWRIEPAMFQAYVRSFQDVFPACALALSQGSYTFLIGFRDDEMRIEWETLSRRLAQCADPVFDDDLTASDLENRVMWFEPQHVLEQITLCPRGVRAYAGEGPLNTDENALLEFALPRSYDINKGREIRRRIGLRRDLLTPGHGEAYDPARHEWIWEYVTGAPAEVLPPQLRLSTPVVGGRMAEEAALDTPRVGGDNPRLPGHRGKTARRQGDGHTPLSRDRLREVRGGRSGPPRQVGCGVDPVQVGVGGVVEGDRRLS